MLSRIQQKGPWLLTSFLMFLLMLDKFDFGVIFVIFVLELLTSAQAVRSSHDVFA